MDWDVASVGKPIPAPYTTQVAKGTVLVDIVNKAANENTDGPYNKWTSTYYGGQGHFITSMDGIEQVCVEDLNSPRWNSYVLYDAPRENLVFYERIISSRREEVEVEIKNDWKELSQRILS